MSRKTALILTAALTMFVIVVAGALAVRLGASGADPTPVAAVETATVEPIVTGDAVRQREALYQQRLEEANTQLQQAYEQLRQLQSQIQQLQAQNATLLQREQIYQQRLEEANRLLQQSVQIVQPSPDSPTGELEARRVTFRSDDDRDDRREHEEREWRGDDDEYDEDEEWDDD